jgi:DNA polymerase III alpha subunit (gram-positive type)
MVVDGWGLPFETALSYAQRGKVNVSVSQEFEEEAEQLLKEWGVSEGITLKTDVLMRDANGNILEALQDLTSGNVAGIPHVDSPNGFWQETVRKTGASSASDLLKIMGFLHSRSVWTDNADKLFVAHRVTLFHIPASPEDVFDMIVEKLRAQGVADVGFALDVAEKAKRGYYQKTGGMDETTRLALLELGFELEFIFFLEEIVYLFPKAKAIEYLKEAIATTWHRRH